MSNVMIRIFKFCGRVVRAIARRVSQSADQCGKLCRIYSRVYLGGFHPLQLTLCGARIFLRPTVPLLTHLSKLSDEQATIRYVAEGLKDGASLLDLSQDDGAFAIVTAASHPKCRMTIGTDDSGLIAGNIRLNNVSNVQTLDLKNGLDGLKDISAEIVRIDEPGLEYPYLAAFITPESGRNPKMVVFRACVAEASARGFHPVEAMWLLADAGYALHSLDSSARLTARQAGAGYDGVVVALKRK